METRVKLLGIDVGRQKERDRDGSKERIFVDKYVGGGGTKPRSGRDRYEIQNMVDVAVGPVAVKPHRSSTETCVYLYYTDLHWLTSVLPVKLIDS